MVPIQLRKYSVPLRSSLHFHLIWNTFTLSSTLLFSHLPRRLLNMDHLSHDPRQLSLMMKKNIKSITSMTLRLGVEDAANGSSITSCGRAIGPRKKTLGNVLETYTMHKRLSKNSMRSFPMRHAWILPQPMLLTSQQHPRLFGPFLSPNTWLHWIYIWLSGSFDHFSCSPLSKVTIEESEGLEEFFPLKLEELLLDFTAITSDMWAMLTAALITSLPAPNPLSILPLIIPYDPALDSFFNHFFAPALPGIEAPMQLFTGLILFTFSPSIPSQGPIIEPLCPPEPDTLSEPSTFENMSISPLDIASLTYAPVTLIVLRNAYRHSLWQLINPLALWKNHKYMTITM